MTSLTRLIKAGAGTAVFDWFAENFPDTKALCSAANTELRGGPPKTPCAVPRLAGSDGALIGTAVEYVLATHLREDALDESIALWVADRILVPGWSRDLPAPNAIASTAVQWIKDTRAWSNPLDDESWSVVIDMSCVLAKFEQVGRAGPALLPQILAPIAEHGHDLRAIARACTSDTTRQDLEAVARATVEDHQHFADATGLHLHPVFAASELLGGADGDLIADGLLLDFKSGADPSLFGRQEAWQLLGYLLADTTDQYELHHVGIAALRRRRTVTWPIQDYLNTLAGQSTEPIERWRAEFERMLTDHAQMISQLP